MNERIEQAAYFQHINHPDTSPHENWIAGEREVYPNGFQPKAVAEVDVQEEEIHLPETKEEFLELPFFMSLYASARFVTDIENGCGFKQWHQQNLDFWRVEPNTIIGFYESLPDAPETPAP